MNQVRSTPLLLGSPSVSPPKLLLAVEEGLLQQRQQLLAVHVARMQPQRLARELVRLLEVTLTEHDRHTQQIEIRSDKDLGLCIYVCMYSLCVYAYLYENVCVHV